MITIAIPKLLHRACGSRAAGQFNALPRAAMFQTCAAPHLRLATRGCGGWPSCCVYSKGYPVECGVKRGEPSRTW
eukprot:6467765-Amphidinium_carterae.1